VYTEKQRRWAGPANEMRTTPKAIAKGSEIMEGKYGSTTTTIAEPNKQGSDAGAGESIKGGDEKRN
jgi:hypothetical protein